MKNYLPPSPLRLLLSAVVCGFAFQVNAMDVTGYSADANRLFQSGFASDSPVLNSSPLFIGSEYNWSGLGWNATPGHGQRVQMFTMVSPIHAFSASHYVLTQNDRFDAQVLTSSGGVEEVTLTTRRRTPTLLDDVAVDLSYTNLSQPIAYAADVNILRVLDVSNNNLTGFSLFMAGSLMPGQTNFSDGPLIATSKVSSRNAGRIFATTSNTDSSFSFREWQSGDSGSPAFLLYNSELTVGGGAWFSSAFSSLAPNLTGGTFTNYNPVPGSNAILASDGYALKWTIYDNPSDLGRTASRWTGGAETENFDTAGNWLHGVVPSNLSVVVDGDTASGEMEINVPEAASLRGILFKASDQADGFTISGDSVTIGAIGIRNEDSAAQTVSTNIVLADSQNWEAAGGDLIFEGNISNNGHLIVAEGGHTTTIEGSLSGSGGLAKDDLGTLIMSSASNTYLGATLIHTGTLRMGVDGALPSANTVRFDAPNPTATLDLDGKQLTVAMVSSDVDRGGTGIIGLGSGGHLTIGGGNVTGHFTGEILGDGQLSKQGSGAWHLTGESRDFEGGVSILRGSLIVNGILGESFDAGNVNINSNAILAGHGYVHGQTFLHSGGILYGYDGGETQFSTLSLGDGLLWNGGGRVLVDLGPGGQSDLFELTDGDLLKGADGAFQFRFLAGPEITTGDFLLMRFGSTTFTASDFTYHITGADLSAFTTYFSIQNNGLYFHVVPEPSSLGLLVLALLAICMRGRGPLRPNLNLQT